MSNPNPATRPTELLQEVYTDRHRIFAKGGYIMCNDTTVSPHDSRDLVVYFGNNEFAGFVYVNGLIYAFMDRSARNPAPIIVDPTTMQATIEI
jgi:hypothetical protein